jgi:succinate dehydrogenase/fumarate reductase flavoprotein subunit
MTREAFDVVVVGSGVSGLTAACVAAAEGRRTLLLEAASLIGGTSAISGGMVWIPADNPETGDTIAAARLYLGETAPNPSDPRIREAFLSRASEAVAYMARRTRVKLRPVSVYPDYYPDRPGATKGGRVLEAVPFDGLSLGRDFGLLRPPLPEFTLFGGMMVSRADIPHFRKVFRNLRSTLRVVRLLGAYAVQRLRAPRGATLYLGNALTGRLFASARDLGVSLRLSTRVEELLVEGGCVSGVVTRSADGALSEVTARAVILATGGFSHDRELRGRHLPQAAGSVSATVPSGATAGARLAEKVGAGIADDAENRAFWVPGSLFTREDGAQGVFPHTVTDRGKPGLIAVDGQGERFVNEALSYHEFVLAMLRSANRAIPAFLVCDAAFLWKYGLGRIKPFTTSVAKDLGDGYLHRGQTIEQLGSSLGVPPEKLAATVASYNTHARRGADPQFGKGGDNYQRHVGDGEHRPNPCVAPLEKPPFYAIAVHPADLGTAAGLRTDDRARVLDANGSSVPGLYACGNDMNSVMGGAYPAPGITLGPALTFGYLAGRDAAAL